MADRSVPDDNSPRPAKSSKVQSEFLEAFAPRAKGPSWLDSDVGNSATAVATTSDRPIHNSDPLTTSDETPSEDEDDVAPNNAESAAMSDLDWMRARMRRSLDEEPSTDKVFHQEGLDDDDGDDEPDRAGRASPEIHAEALDDSSQQSSALQTKRLFLRNLAYVCTEDDIRQEFGRFGTIEQVGPCSFQCLPFALPCDDHSIGTTEVLSDVDHRER